MALLQPVLSGTCGCMQIERSIETKYNRTAKHIDDSAEIALLEAENERLR